MTIYYITEIDLKNYNHSRYFKIDLPAANNDGYKQIVSWNAFFYSTRNKKPNRNINNYLYVSHTEDEFWNRDLEIPIVDVQTVWEFYDKIGYDYKVKKYA